MPQAVADPEALKRFASQLQNFTQTIQTGQTVLTAQLNALGDTWRDQEHMLFVQEFEQTIAVLEKFLETADQHIPFLLRKAERIEEYLQQR